MPKISDLMRFLPDFGKMLRDYRTMRGLNVEDVATAAGIAPSALRDMEAGKRGAPSVGTVKLLADALQLTSAERGSLIDASELRHPILRAALGQEPEEKVEASFSAAILVFLIADIRGYTSFTQQRGDQAAARLATRFAELVRGVTERWDGRVVETRGDEVLCAFASARQAVSAAGELQARYTDEADSHPEIPPGIGVGLDLGEAVQVGDGYRGAALNRAARLCALAGAGEVLVSPGIVYVAPHVDGVRFVARGQEYLKGFADPVQIVLAETTGLIEAGETPPEPAEETGEG
jgi:class 3 adenylate cyclase